MNWIQKLKLKKEANLLDSKLFIAKTFLAISFAYFVTSPIEFVSRDMISVLFGLILTLEPVNTMGIKNGWDQIFASFVGATATSMIIIFFGVNAFTIGASVAVTLYISLLINWRNVSVVALFTAIYMTQYLQMGPDGQPSVWITFQLRFAALSSGVAIAILFNYLFSIIQYRIISQKRLVYLLKRLLTNMAETQSALKTCDPVDFQNVRKSLLSTANSLDWATGLFESLCKEAKIQHNMMTVNGTTVGKSREAIAHMTNISHLMFDINYVLGEEKVKQEDLIEIADDLNVYFDCIMDNLGSIKAIYEGHKGQNGCCLDDLKIHELPIRNEYAARIERNLRDINKAVKHIADLGLGLE